MTADIKQTFLQIGLKDNEKDIVRFLWYDEEITQDWPTQSPRTFRMKRVVFGVRSRNAQVKYEPYIGLHVDLTLEGPQSKHRAFTRFKN